MNKLEMCMEKFPQTDIWLDGFNRMHHEYAVQHHCKGITTSPTWVGHMLVDEIETEKDNIRRIIAENPAWDEREIAWQWTLEKARERSECMLPLWRQGNPRNGRFSVQLSIYDYRDSEKMLRMAREVHACGPNMQVKIPCSRAGVQVMEQATYEGISVMATLVYSLDQAVAAAQAIERGMARRAAEGKDNSHLNPVCAVLLGMQEDWLKSYADANNIILDPQAFLYAGEAVCKQVYAVFQQRNYKTRVLVAYYRHHRHWSAFMGGDIIMTIPYKWQKRFEACEIPVENNMEKPVPERYMRQLNTLAPFRDAVTEHSLDVEAFDSFPPVILTLRYFIELYEKGVMLIRDLMLPKLV